jgi:hypothetical protein
MAVAGDTTLKGVEHLMTTVSRAQRYIDLRERYGQCATALYFQRQFTGERQERQVIGRRKTLEALVQSLEPIVPGMGPARVGELVLSVLDKLAEDKATWLINSIKRRREFHINELGEYTAEGAIAQIDEVIPELLAGLATRTSPVPQVHGRYFQVYRQPTPVEQIDVCLWQERWYGDRRGDWFLDVAIVCVEQPGLALEQLFQTLCFQLREKPTVRWLRQGMSNAAPVAGDIVVSMLSGAAWLVNGAGSEAFELLASAS